MASFMQDLMEDLNEANLQRKENWFKRNALLLMGISFFLISMSIGLFLGFLIFK